MSSEKDRITRLLGSLASRKTIDSTDDKEGIFQQQLTSQIDRVRQHVNSLEPGAGLFRCFWIIGESGNGKSQTLSRLASDFRAIVGSDRITLSTVDIILEEATLISDIERRIFLNSFAVSSKVESRASETIRDITRSTSKAGNTTEKFLEFGLELAQVFELSLPPFSSALALLTFNTLADRWKRSPQNIRRSLLKKNAEWGENEEALDFMVNWISYCFKPTSERWSNLDMLAKNYSAREGLFTFLCQLLLKGGFSTFIILLDEVSILASGQIQRLLRLIRDRSGLMNITVVCTGLPEIEAVINKDEQLRRRFWLKDDVFHLPRPQVFSDYESQDDFNFAKNKIIDLCGKLAKPHKTPSKQEEIDVRSKLTNNNSALTWSVLWEEVSILYNPLLP